MRRAHFMVPLPILLAFIVASGSGAFGAAPAASRMSPTEALRTLMEGNQRFAASSYSDSRVPPEIIFDQGLGDVFVVRVAGNTIDQLGLQTLAYGVEHLGTSLILVLGHDSCGAVKAAVETYPKPDVGVMLTNIYPAVEATRNRPGDAVSNAIDRNVELMVAQLKASPTLADRVRDGRLAIVGGRYNLKSGKVTIFQP
jgi:carbonic anhydrase